MARDLARRALIVSVRNWLGAARLPESLSKAGFQVASLSFAGGLITQSSFLSRHFLLPQAATDDELILAIITAMQEYRPDLFIPGDDPAVELLHAVAAELFSRDDSEWASRLEASLGEPRFYSSVQSRQRVSAIASQLGLRVPEHGVITNVEEAQQFGERYGYPIVLKAESSCGGWGVSICEDASHLQTGLATLHAFWAVARQPGNVTVQKFIRGKTAMRALTAWKGRVLAGLSAQKLEVNPTPTGASSVVQFIDNAQMDRSTEALIAALGFSGFASADFIIEEETGHAYLIELNPRPTPICHLGGTFGPDLCAALMAALNGESAPADSTASSAAGRIVALFPQEWVRHRESRYIREAFHDVPWNDPLLLQAYVACSGEDLRDDERRWEERRRATLRARAYATMRS